MDAILLLPIGERWLLEAEGEFEGDFEHDSRGWKNDHDTRFDYVQIDLFASPYLTVVAGRYLTRSAFSTSGCTRPGSSTSSPTR